LDFGYWPKNGEKHTTEAQKSIEFIIIIYTKLIHSSSRKKAFFLRNWAVSLWSLFYLLLQV